ncbi:MAG: CAP domain-containing protein [Moorellales bacterium]
MKADMKPVFLALLAILVLVLPSPPVQAAVSDRPAPGQSVEQWYLQYLQQYSRSGLKPTPSPAPPSPPATPAAPPAGGSRPQVEPSSPAPEPPSDLTPEEAELYRWINAERAKAGQPPVEADLELVRLARLKAQDVATYDYYGHTSPTYGTPGQMLTAAGYPWSACGETIAKAGSAYKAHRLLMASSAHRAIILSPTYTRVGIGVAPYVGRSGLVVVELFVRP